MGPAVGPNDAKLWRVLQSSTEFHDELCQKRTTHPRCHTVPVQMSRSITRASRTRGRLPLSPRGNAPPPGPPKIASSGEAYSFASTLAEAPHGAPGSHTRVLLCLRARLPPAARALARRPPVGTRERYVPHLVVARVAAVLVVPVPLLRDVFAAEEAEVGGAVLLAHDAVALPVRLPSLVPALRAPLPRLAPVLLVPAHRPPLLACAAPGRSCSRMTNSRQRSGQMLARRPTRHQDTTRYRWRCRRGHADRCGGCGSTHSHALNRVCSLSVNNRNGRGGATTAGRVPVEGVDKSNVSRRARPAIMHDCQPSGRCQWRIQRR